MATYTPNIELKKPAGGEYWSTTDYNNNLDKLDTAIAARATKKNLTNGSISATSLADYQAQIDAMIATMTDGTVCICYSYPNFTGWGVAGSIIITRRSSSNYSVLVSMGTVIRLGYYYSSAWHWYNVAATAI